MDVDNTVRKLRPLLCGTFDALQRSGATLGDRAGKVLKIIQLIAAFPVLAKIPTGNACADRRCA
jgi:hypothetical protein